MIELCAVGGYSEVGKNCTAVKIDNEVIILDLGLMMEKYIEYTQDEDIVELSPKKLISVGAIPDINMISDWQDKVKAICISHAHLDHVGAVPFLANRFKCPVHGTPYTIEVLKAIIKDEKLTLRNELIKHNVNTSFRVSDNIEIEFINMTHSTPQTVMIAIHTKYGIVVYGNDFKFDNYPILGKMPNYERLKELKGKVKILIVDSLYSRSAIKMPSELVAKEMLRDVLLGVNTEGRAIIVTTFSSHLARLKSIMEFGKKLNRKVVFLGRSISKYVSAGEAIGLVDFSKHAEIYRYGNEIQKFLKKLKNPEKYLLVVTGHQGEPKSTLSKMVNKEFFHFRKEDCVIFSCTIIPTPINFKNREALERALKDKHVRIFRDIHVSGHAAKEDIRDLINMLQPKYLFPSHSTPQLAMPFIELAEEMGYKNHKNVFLLKPGQRMKIN